MLIRSQIAYAPEMEQGTADTGGQDAPAPRVPINETPADGPGSGRGAIRKELEKSVEQDRKGREAAERTPPAKKAARPAINNQVEEPEAEAAEAGAEGVQEEPGQEQQLTPPEGFSKEAKAEWAKTPPTVQAAILKREEDMSKGVGELKKRYGEIDRVLAPRMQVITENGHTPAAAVNQLFSWMEALTVSPQQAFPALAQSFGFDLRTLFEPGQQEQQQPGAEQPAGTVAPEVQQYITKLQSELAEFKRAVGDQLGGLQNTFAQSMQAKTQEILDNWSKDKPYFKEAGVREGMAHFIGTGQVPVLPNGAADLDTAYDMAIHSLKPVREKVLTEKAAAERKAAAEKEAKEKKLRQEQADKARRAAGGALTGSAPGNPVAPNSQRKGAGKSVRESIQEAREELSS